MAQEWALGSAILFAAFTALRIRLNPKSKWQALIPGGIAVAVGMCVPSGRVDPARTLAFD
jgi:hypothetical protein